MLVTMKEILLKAREGNYAVAAPNIIDEGTARAVIEVAEEMNAPMIIDLDYAIHEKDFDYFGRMVCDLIEKSPVPMCLNLDHGQNYMEVCASIKAGFTSVMADYSTLPFEKNVELVKEVVNTAKQLGITVEAELGHVGYGSNYEVDGYSNLTDPEEAGRYVELTGVDCLAVAIGNAHGLYKGTPYIDFDRLAEIQKYVKVPLVLHGGSGTGDENLARAARSGINKVNLCSDLYIAGKERILKACSEGPEFKTFEFYSVFLAGFKDKLRHYVKIFGQDGKAWKKETSNISKTLFSTSGDRPL